MNDIYEIRHLHELCLACQLLQKAEGTCRERKWLTFCAFGRLGVTGNFLKTAYSSLKQYICYFRPVRISPLHQLIPPIWCVQTCVDGSYGKV